MSSLNKCAALSLKKLLIDAKLGMLLVIGSGKIQIMLSMANVSFIKFLLSLVVPIHQSLFNAVSAAKL